MAAQIKVEVIKSEMIKPSTPTSDRHRNFKLSLIDQIAPFFRTLIILFYPSTNLSLEQRSDILKTSLSHTLNKLYPFAGRLRDNLWVDCNDAGAELVIARVHSPGSNFLKNPNSKEMLRLLVPPNNESSKEDVFSSPLLLVRASFFECGAMSICVRLSHKVGDGTSVRLLLRTWTAVASSNLTEGVSFTPQLASSSLFPPSDSMASNFTSPNVMEKVKVKRLSFSGREIEALRKRAASPSVPNPSRVEAVLAMVWRALIFANPRSKSVITPHVNVRKMVAGDRSPQNYVGNVAWIYKLESKSDEAGLKELVISLRKGYESFKESCERRVEMEGIKGFIEEIRNLKEEDESVRIYAASSLCRFGWYGVDFGWGKPSLVCIPNLTHKDTVYMLDSIDGDGIDVWLSLSEPDMALFERNYQLLAFHSIITASAM